MKIIKAFIRRDYGLYIDLEDMDSSVAVNPQNGDILLNEGEGDDRYHGAVIFPRDFDNLEINIKTSKYRLILNAENLSHELGVIKNEDLSDAKKWVDEVTTIINNLK